MLDRILHFLVSDTFLACLIPILLFVFSVLLLGTPEFPVSSIRRLLADVVFGRRVHATPGYFSVARAVLSYDQYAKLSERELRTMRASYAKLGRAHKRVGYELGYPRKLDRHQEATRTNAYITKGIADLARAEFPDKLDTMLTNHETVSGDLGRVREALKHFIRDWSDGGKAERSIIFDPILDVLRQTEGKRSLMRVLVPGSGLGRLAWEISNLGFQTTANDLSFFMNLAFRFLLSEYATQQANQHVLQPYAHWFSHQRTSNALFRQVTFPDVVPRLSPTFHLAETDFLSLRAPGPGYDCIVTLFFIDTSLNVIETIEHIHALLRPGGTWINLGPLLWTGSGQAAVELSLDEIIRLVELTGFKLASEGLERRRTIESEYTADRQAMMKWLYQAEFWVATKT